MFRIFCPFDLQKMIAANYLKHQARAFMDVSTTGE